MVLIQSLDNENAIALACCHNFYTYKADQYLVWFWFGKRASKGAVLGAYPLSDITAADIRISTKTKENTYICNENVTHYNPEQK